MTDAPHATVPLVDEQPGGRTWSPAVLRAGIVGAVAGALLLGALAFALATGIWTVAGLGQIAAAGPAAVTFAGAGVGGAVGALLGALAAIFRMPSRRHGHGSQA